LKCGGFYIAADQWMLHFDEKGGKSRETPLRHNLEQIVSQYAKGQKQRDHSLGTVVLHNQWRAMLLLELSVCRFVVESCGKRQLQK
jgi:hypothetical protein